MIENNEPPQIPFGLAVLLLQAQVLDVAAVSILQQLKAERLFQARNHLGYNRLRNGEVLGRFRHAPVFHDGDKHIQLP